MARIRTIKPTFFRSRAVRKLSSNDVRLLWVGLWPLSDDEGRMLDEPEQLVGDLWALELNAEQIEAALSELHKHGRIVRYEVDGERFMQVTNWLDHQRIQKPNASEIPPIPVSDNSDTTTGTVSVGREGKGRGREGNARALTPFCIKHPTGTDSPCRACGNARRAFDADVIVKKNKPTVPGIITLDYSVECGAGHHKWTRDGTCAVCPARREAVAS